MKNYSKKIEESYRILDYNRVTQITAIWGKCINTLMALKKN
jgi:hypothetical protein